jgi:hypothetical protein
MPTHTAGGLHLVSSSQEPLLVGERLGEGVGHRLHPYLPVARRFAQMSERLTVVPSLWVDNARP